MVQLAQGDEHEGTALARGGWGLDEQILLPPLPLGPFLHGAHSQFIGGPGGTAVLPRGERDGGKESVHPKPCQCWGHGSLPPGWASHGGAC